MATDIELLTQFAEKGDEAAFAEVVRRHVDLIYASALRLLNGDSALAQDVTQTVFTDLARKAAVLGAHASVAGWLHTGVRFAASNAIRIEQRRRAREQTAYAMNEQATSPDLNWMQLRPLIDEAVGQLLAPERDAVLLRYFEGKSHREVGDALGVTESAARMRVDRAVDKMRSYFSRHGVTTTGALLVSTLGAKAASMAAPLTFTAGVAGKALLGAKAMGGMATVATSQKWFTYKVAAVLVGTTLLGATSVASLRYFSNDAAPAATPAAVKARPVANASAVPAKTATSVDPASVIAAATTVAMTVANTAPAAAQTANDLLTQAGQTTSPANNNNPTAQPANNQTAPQVAGNEGITSQNNQVTQTSGDGLSTENRPGAQSTAVIAVASIGATTPMPTTVITDSMTKPLLGGQKLPDIVVKPLLGDDKMPDLLPENQPDIVLKPLDDSLPNITVPDDNQLLPDKTRASIPLPTKPVVSKANLARPVAPASTVPIPRSSNLVQPVSTGSRLQPPLGSSSNRSPSNIVQQTIRPSGNSVATPPPAASSAPAPTPAPAPVKSVPVLAPITMPSR